MDISKETKELKTLLNSFGDKKYAIIRSVLFDEANKLSGNETGNQAVSLHRACNHITDVIIHFTPEYFNNL